MTRKAVYYLEPSEKVANWHVYKCPHCDSRIHSPYESDRVSCDCFTTPAWHEFGAWAEIALQVIGITKARWSWLTGHKGGCEPCDQRQAALNTWGQKLRGIMSRLWYNSPSTKE